MFSFLFPSKPVVATVNGQAVTVRPKETLLQAALREGIEFPHSCRVGGCAACKCKLTSGQVKRLTQFGYVLSDDDLQAGHILACQSVPKGDVSVEVPLHACPARKTVSARVLRQERLTHDTLRLQVQLNDVLVFKAGQFADLELAAQPGVSRSYSFATPCGADGQTSFFIRKVPGGVFSSMVHDHDWVGQTLTVTGPCGDFWLRPSDAPLLMVAGGSGLAPMVAMLQEAVEAGVRRKATLLFGARTQQDLYELTHIQAIAERWLGGFEFVPVLSAEPEGSAWAGARGLITDWVPRFSEPTCHAYLCGPPPMVDSAQRTLWEQGVEPSLIHADRFLTQHDLLKAG